MPLATLLLCCVLFVHATNDTPLHKAVEKGDIEQVRQLLEMGADINAIGTNGSTPLHYARSPEMIELLLKKKPDLSIRDRAWNLTAMQSVAMYLAWAQLDEPKLKYQKLIDAYLKSGIEPDLITSIYLNDVERVKKLLVQSPQWADDFQEHSPLRIGASVGRTKICKYLLDNFKVDVDDFRRGQGFPIIKGAVAFPEIVQMLINHKADLTTRISWGGFIGRQHVVIGGNATALHFAASDGAPESITLLIDGGADVFARSGEHHTPLEIAAIYGNAEHAQAILNHPKFKTYDPRKKQPLLDQCLVLGLHPMWLARNPQRFKLAQVLISNGANPKAKHDGKTAIQVAAGSIVHSEEKNQADMLLIVPFLRKKGAILNLTDAVSLRDEDAVAGLLKLEPKSVNEHRTDGATPLHLAVLLSEKQIAKLLLESGADVHAWNNRQFTPLHEAVRYNSLVLAELLLEKGADPDARDRDNKTPLDWLKERDKDTSDMEKLLTKYRKKK